MGTETQFTFLYMPTELHLPEEAIFNYIPKALYGLSGSAHLPYPLQVHVSLKEPHDNLQCPGNVNLPQARLWTVRRSIENPKKM